MKKYLKNSAYLKLFLWFVSIFVTSLFGETFVFLMVFNSLLAFSLAVDNHIMLLFLLSLWVWMFFLVFCKEFQTFNGFLSSIQDYFSAEACSPFMGHHLGDSLHKKVGVLLIWTTVVAVVFGIICCICTLEYQITYYATKKCLNTETFTRIQLVKSSTKFT